MSFSYVYTHILSYICYHGTLNRFSCAVQQVCVDQPFHIKKFAFANPRPPVHPSPPPPFPFGNHTFWKLDLCHHISKLLPTSQITTSASIFLTPNSTPVLNWSRRRRIKEQLEKKLPPLTVFTTAHLAYMILYVPQKCSHFRTFKTNETFISVTFIL